MMHVPLVAAQPLCSQVSCSSLIVVHCSASICQRYIIALSYATKVATCTWHVLRLLHVLQGGSLGDHMLSGAGLRAHLPIL